MGGGRLRHNSAFCKGPSELRVELTNRYAYHCTPYIRTKFQLSILLLIMRTHIYLFIYLFGPSSGEERYLFGECWATWHIWHIFFEVSQGGTSRSVG